MKVERLSLKKFRNITDAVLEPGPRINFLIGSNGQGKTTFLESLGLFATLRSFRGSKNGEMIQHGRLESELSCQIGQGSSAPEAQTKDRIETQLRLRLHMSDPETRKATKTAYINERAFKSSTAYLTQRFGSYRLGFHAVSFNPSDHDLVRGEPMVRRNYLDRILSANDQEYLKQLQKYNRVLEQRNAVLKNHDRPQPGLLEGFTQPLGKHAAVLTKKRLEWFQEVGKTLNDTAHRITFQNVPLHAVYCSNWAEKLCSISVSYGSFLPPDFTGQVALPSLELLEQTFWKKASTLEALEWRAGHTLIGPHRDDWMFFLGALPLRGHGSQGEIRSTLLAMKISEIEIFRKTTGHSPIFLLDDFSSELDQRRRGFLLKFLSETNLQVFVTTTEDQRVEGDCFRVSNGEVNKV